MAALALVALLVAGCGGGASTDDADTATSAPSTGKSQSTSAQDKGVRFAECMRSHGVTDYPDPTGASDQELVEAIQALDTSSPAWKKAMTACRELRPAGLLGGKATQQEMTRRLAFARCIREHGVKDFPDPIDGEPLVDTNRIPSSATSDGMTILNAAMAACGDVIGDSVGPR